MNLNLKSILSNISHTFFANIISSLISGVMLILVPKFMGVEQYGYWQLYVFYTTYIGFLHLGWCDGIYLRYGGQKYSDLDSSKFTTQFWLLLLMVIGFSGIIVTIQHIFIADINKKIIIIMTCVCGLVQIQRTFLFYILQGSGRIKEYARLMILDRLLFIGFLVLLLGLNIRNYLAIIIIDIISRFFSLLVAAILCRAMVVGQLQKLKLGIKEAKENISVGINLMAANIASGLIIGIIRFGIEDKWNIETFGQISLALSLTNIILNFINMVAIVLFPMLRRTEQNKLSEIYIVLRKILILFILGALVIYFPVKNILELWLPKYTMSFKYLGLIFPMCIYESKTSMLINTYLKNFRKEKWILGINIGTVLLSIILSYLTIYLLEDLNMAIVSITALTMIRCIVSEALLSSLLKITIVRETFQEFCVSILFMILCWYISKWYLSLLLYIFMYLVYVFINRIDIKNIFKIFKKLF